MILAVDTETTGTDFFHGCRAFLVSACNGSDNFWWRGEVNPYTREVYWEDEMVQEIQTLLDSATQIIFHNTQFDMRALSHMGIKIDHLWDRIDDTVLAAHAVNSAHNTSEAGNKSHVGRSFNLKELCFEYFGWYADDEEELDKAVQRARPIAAQKGWSIAKLGHSHFPAAKGAQRWYKMDMWLCPEECEKYACLDVERTFVLWHALYEGMMNDGLIAGYKMRRELLRICYDMTSVGMNMYEDAIRTDMQLMEKKMNKIRRFLCKQLGINWKFNWSKPDHLNLLLHKHLGIEPTEFTKKGKPSTNKKAMKVYTENNPSKELKAVYQAKRIEYKYETLSGYLKWAKDGAIHSNTNITGTRETRQSSSAPNTQNITGPLRKYFGPPPEYVWLEADFVNIELRIWAYSTGNEDLIHAFESGKSVHRMVMEELFPQQYEQYLRDPNNERLKRIYTEIKNGNFAIIYGGTEAKVDDTYGKKGAYRQVINRFPGIQEYTDSLIKQVHENHEIYGIPSIFTIYNYRLTVPLDEPFKACNYYVQGSAGIFMTKAMIEVDKNFYYRKHSCRMINQVHDSLKVQIPFHDTIRTTCYSIIDSMENCAPQFGRCPSDYELKFHPSDKAFKI